MHYSLNVNGQNAPSIREDTPLLWVLRDAMNLKARANGCGAGCAAPARVTCDRGTPVQSCQIRFPASGTSKVVTIEGIGRTAIGNA